MAFQSMTVKFSGQTLDQVRKAARILGIPDERLGDVLIQGIKLISLTENGKVIIDKPNERLTVDVKRI